MKRAAGRQILVSLIILFGVLLACPSVSVSEEDWIKEFEEICGRTEESGGMTDEELRAIVERSEKLKKVIEQSDHPHKKVYLFRLDKCKKLFLYVLEVNQKNVN